MADKQWKTVALSVAKWVFLILIVLFIFWQVFSRGSESRADFSQVSEAVVSAADLSDMTEGDNQMVRRLYGLDPADYDGVLLYYPSSNMGAEEILVVRLRDMAQQETVEAAMRARIQSQMDVFEGYAPEQYATLEQGVVEVQGNYLLLVVAKDTAPVRQAFLDAL